MNSKNTLYEFALGHLRNLGPLKTQLLCSKIHDLNDLFELTDQELHELYNVNIDVIKKINRGEALEKGKEDLLVSEKNNIKNLFFKHKEYPNLLSQCPDAPINLLCKGNLELNNKRFISIVGTRQPSSYGLSILNELISSLKNIPNIVIVSGMAYGIDIQAHRLCIKYGIPNIAVLGHGFNFLYPSAHKKEALEIEENGLLLTEFSFHVAPVHYNFPRRNRIIAGLSEATIIVESKLSGGSLITARNAFDYNREVFAYPGSVFSTTSKGCNLLIKQGIAQSIESSVDFLSAMDFEKSIQKEEMVQYESQEQASLMRLLDFNAPKSIDELHCASGFSLQKINQLLLELELNGLIAKKGQNSVIKCH